MQLLIHLRWLPLFFLCAAAASASSCELTQIFSGHCNERGWVQVPDTLSTVKAPALFDCAALCYSDKKCKSFRYVADSTDCYMYGKYLDDMYTDFYDYQTGTLFNRDCFTKNCNRIKACNASKKCHIESPAEYDNVYQQFACQYGHTMRPYKEHYAIDRSTLKGSLTSCEAIKGCAEGNFDGTFDVFYHIPSKKWLCTSYTNDINYYYYPTLEMQEDGPLRYSVRNSSVGAGYGYALTFMDPGD